MRSLIFMLLILLIAPAIGWYFISGQRPSAPSLPSLGDMLPDVRLKASAPEPAPTTVYKWRDAAGNWQFGDRPPAGVAYELQRIEPIATYAAPEPAPAAPKPQAADVPSGSPALLPITNPQAVKQLVEQARGVEQLMQQRGEQIDRASRP